MSFELACFCKPVQASADFFLKNFLKFFFENFFEKCFENLFEKCFENFFEKCFENFFEKYFENFFWKKKVSFSNFGHFWILDTKFVKKRSEFTTFFTNWF